MGEACGSLILENELLHLQISEQRDSILSQRVEILKIAGFSDDEIRLVVWSQIGVPLAELGRHQDAKLIESAEVTPGEPKSPDTP